MKREDMAPGLNHNQQTTQSKKLRADRSKLHKDSLAPLLAQNVPKPGGTKAVQSHHYCFTYWLVPSLLLLLKM